jgi:hypothetical protein
MKFITLKYLSILHKTFFIIFIWHLYLLSSNKNIIYKDFGEICLSCKLALLFSRKMHVIVFNDK